MSKDALIKFEKLIVQISLTDFSLPLLSELVDFHDQITKSEMSSISKEKIEKYHNLLNHALIVLLKDKDHIVENIPLFKKILNAGAFLSNEIDKDLQWLAKSPCFDVFPRPEINDTGYREFYFIVEAIRKNHFLAHRTDISGSGDIKGHEYTWHGGFADVMVPEMAASFQRFVSCLVKHPSQQAFFKEIPYSENLLSLLKQVAEDISKAILCDDVESIQQKLKTPVVLLASTLKVPGSSSTHSIAVAFYQDICLIADRGRRHQSGFKIFQLSGSPEEQLKRKTAIAKICAQSVRSPFTYSFVSVNQCEEYFTEQLNMQEIGYLPLPLKYGSNCSWSSCAQMLLLSALYIRFYEAAKAKERTEVEAHQLAQNQAKLIFNIWSRDDFYVFLKSYIDYYQQPEMQAFGPEKLLLNVAYLRASKPGKKQRVVPLLEQSGVISKENLVAAKMYIAKMLQELLMAELKKQSLNLEIDFEKPAMMMTELYLLTNKRKVEQVYQQMETGIKRGDMGLALETLEGALTRAHQEYGNSCQVSL